MAKETIADKATAGSTRVLQKRRQELVDRRGRIQQRYRLIMNIGPTMLIGSAGLVALTLASGRSSGSLYIGGIVGFYGILCITAGTTLRQTSRDIETDIQDLDYQIDLQQLEVNPSERRAEKILRINDNQLRRYYDLNLSQNFWVFSLGVFCIALGVSVIATTLYLVLRVASTPQAQVVTAILGGSGALFTNVIAAIYLKMNTTTSDNLAAFHAKLVETNRLLLANLLASRVDDTDKRNDTFANIAVGLTSVSQTIKTPVKPRSKDGL